MSLCVCGGVVCVCGLATWWVRRGDFLESHKPPVHRTATHIRAIYSNAGSSFEIQNSTFQFNRVTNAQSVNDGGGAICIGTGAGIPGTTGTIKS